MARHGVDVAGASRGGDHVDAAPRVGLTLTKKVGNAVVRNRARRRLRAALRLDADLPARNGHDYVVIGRIEAIRLPFADLESELARAFIGVHDASRHKRGAAQRGSGQGRPQVPIERSRTP